MISTVWSEKRKRKCQQEQCNLEHMIDMKTPLIDSRNVNNRKSPTHILENVALSKKKRLRILQYVRKMWTSILPTWWQATICNTDGIWIKSGPHFSKGISMAAGYASSSVLEAPNFCRGSEVSSSFMKAIWPASGKLGITYHMSTCIAANNRHITCLETLEPIHGVLRSLNRTPLNGYRPTVSYSKVSSSELVI